MDFKIRQRHCNRIWYRYVWRNEWKGLVASLLFCQNPSLTVREIHVLSWESVYGHNMYWTICHRTWSCRGTEKESFRIDAPHMPNGSASTLHLAITDETGNTAVLEYLDGNLSIHEGKEFQVMTNSPRYDYQLAINDYWKEIGGLQMLPGTNRSSDRFVRASFIYMQSLRLRTLK